MTPRLLALILLICLVPVFSHAQINDCALAQVVCSDEDLTFNPQGPGENDFADPDNIEGCITALEQNSAWYYFEINPAAPPNLVLGFIINPFGGYGEDYDWALFGPDVTCGALGAPIRCSSSSFACMFCPQTGMGMGTMDVTEGPGTGDGFVMTLIVQPGQGFYLLIDNWQGTNNGFQLKWTDSAAPWLNCDAVPPCALTARAGEDLSACEGEEDIQLTGESSGNHGNETYSWSGTNGGTAFLSDPDAQNPTVNIPLGFSGTITYTLTVVEDTCMGVDDVELTVHPLPELEITEVDPLCANNAPYTLTAVPGGGIWGGAATGNTFNPATNGPGIHTVTYTYTDLYMCTNSSSIDVEVYEIPEVTIDPSPAVFCDSEAPGQLTASASGGAPGYTYSWTTPTETADGNIYNAEVTGLYTMVVTDNNGCTGSATTTVTFNANPTVQITDPGPLCGNISTYTLTGTPTGGAFSGSFISPSGELHPDAIPPGTFQVSYTYEDANHCESTDFQNITILPAPSVDAQNNGPLCEGTPIQLTGISDTIGPGVTFAWTGPSGFTSNVQNPNNATLGGVYTFQSILGACASPVDTTVVMISPRPDAAATNDGPYCGIQTNQLNGITTATDPSVIFIWTGPNGFQSNLQNPSDTLDAGLYTFIVDINGCQSLPATTTLNVFPEPQINITGQHIICTGFTTTLDAGPGYASYLWNNNSTSQTLVVSSTGIYTVTATDNNGCTGTSSFDVTEQPSLTPVISGTLEFCEGLGTVLDAGPGYVSYTWSTGETSQTIAVDDGSNYGVIVYDADGCSGSANVTTIEHPNPNVMIGGSTTYCIGGFTIIDAGAGYTSYLWNDNSTNQTLTVSTPGTYSVNVVDPFGCQGSASVMIDESTSLHPVVTGNYAFCQGGNTVLNAGTGFATYLWSDNSTNQTLTVNTAGNYWVSVSDGQGCSGADTVAISEVLPPFAQLQPGATLCNTQAGGSVIDLYNLVISGDVNGTWQDLDNSGAVGLFTSLDFKGVAAGDYRFVYTTNSAIAPCPEETYQVVITIIDCTCPDVFFFTASPLCNDNGMLDLTSIENTSEAGAWNMIQTPPGTNPGKLTGTLFDATGSDPGTYTFQFTLQNQPPPGCLLDYQTTVEVDRSVFAGIGGSTSVYCYNVDQLVFLQLAIGNEDPGGVWTETSTIPSLGNAFDPVNATFHIKGQPVGSYTFQYTVTGGGACPDDSSLVTVNIITLPVVTIAEPTLLSCANPEIVLDAGGSSFGSNFVNQWTGPGIMINGSENTLHPTVNKAGEYILTINNSLTGCTNADTVHVIGTTDAPSSALVNVRNPSCHGDQDAFIHITQVNGGTSPYQYILNNGTPSDSPNFDQLAAGDYTVDVVDVNGCRWDTLINITEPPIITLELGPDIEIDLGEDAHVEAIVNLPPGEIDTLLWNPSDIVECIDITCLEATVHASNTVLLQATLIAISGCSVSDELIIKVNKDRRLFIPNVFSPNDDSINDVFYIFGNEHQIASIKKLQVFNRWGDFMYEATDLLPNDPTKGWNGRFKDVLVNPGVYVYAAEVEYIDGVVEVVTGDVTVVR